VYPAHAQLPAGQGPGAMTSTRVLTAAVLIPLAVAAVLWTDTWVIAGLVAGLLLLCMNEFFRLAAAAGLKGHPRWTSACALFLAGLQWLEASHRGLWMRSDFGMLYSPDRSPAPPEMAFAVFLLGAAMLAVMGKRQLGDVLAGLAADSAAMVLVALPFSFVVRLHGLHPLGPRVLLFLLVLLWVGDTLAYFAGRAIGRHKLAPEISPGKTWEGAAANLAGSALVGLAAARWIAVPPAHLLAVAVLANLAGQLGDLTESAYKRSAGAKDSGTLLPGHGGMLDRLDSLIFAAPVVWYYFSMLLPAAG
jgi:phosphatidate cytidylyltransferase